MFTLLGTAPRLYLTFTVNDSSTFTSWKTQNQLVKLLFNIALDTINQGTNLI